MALPFALPDWLPGWAAAALLVPLLLFLLSFVLMPFNVFGIKGRLDQIDVRLDDIQGEIRALALRLPEPGHPDLQGRQTPARPPIPPQQPPIRGRMVADMEPEWDDEPAPMQERRPRTVLRRPAGSRAAPDDVPERGTRSEPRLNWPR
jgi:hypothetical protein